MSTALPTLPQGPASPWPWPPVVAEPAPAVASCPDAPERPPERKRPPKRSPLATMLDEACDWIDRLLVLPSPHARDLLALWAAASGARIDGRLVWDMAVRLALISDDPASAKSLALRILMALSYKGETVEDPSGPGLLDMIVEDQQSIGVDEFDILIEGSGGSKMTRTIINGGAYPEGKTSRKGHKGTSTFAWLALCGLAQAYRSHPKLRAVRTRGIPVEMRQARPDELAQLEEYDRSTHLPLLRMLGSALADCVGRNAKRLARMQRTATVPAGVVAREREKWRPLLAVAELADEGSEGPDWAERARAACRWFSQGESDDHGPALTPRQQLVTDMETAMMGELFVRTLVLLERLAEMGWPFTTGDPDTATGQEQNRAAGQELSRMLGGYLSPEKRRIGGRPVQGYLLDEVTEYREAIVPTVPTVPTDAERSDRSDPEPVAYEDVEPEDALIC